MNHSEQLNDLAKALVAALGEFPTVAKDSNNPLFKSKYAGLPEVMKTASPVLAKHGLAVSQFVTHEGAESLLQTYLLHESGQFITQAMPLLLTKQDAQGQGSAITYARRYSYMSVLGLVADEDDDGNAASLQTKKPVPIAASAPYKPKEPAHVSETTTPPTTYVPPAKPAPSSKPGLINPASMEQLKAGLHAKGLTGDKATEFSQWIIGKDKPENESDVQGLINALQVKA